MNLLKLIEILQSEGGQLETAFGTDFSPPMIDAAIEEAAKHLPPELNQKINFVVAGNEKLMTDLARGLDQSSEQLKNTFDCIVGVNTFRYAHRLQSENQCALDIFDLLRPGGYSVMIDMNRDFPFFRSKLRRMFSARTNETYVPSLKEYTRPFKEVGFKKERRKRQAGKKEREKKNEKRKKERGERGRRKERERKKERKRGKIKERKKERGGGGGKERREREEERGETEREGKKKKLANREISVGSRTPPSLACWRFVEN